jgi:ArsR family transcriptional regulator
MFELSHPSRLKALRILNEKPHRLTDISKVLNLTSAEISRHLGRLINAKLITKDSQGNYILTPFGEIILFELSKLKFLTAHNKYFLTHDLSVIPEELRWLNAMSRSEMIQGTLEIMSRIEDLTKNAKRHFLFISDQPMRAVATINLEMAKKGVEFKMIYPKNSEVPDEYHPKKKIPIHVRLLDKVPLSMKKNEKLGGLALPDMDGKVDYAYALMGSEPQFMRWIDYVFDYYWQKAESAF